MNSFISSQEKKKNKIVAEINKLKVKTKNFNDSLDILDKNIKNQLITKSIYNKRKKELSKEFNIFVINSKLNNLIKKEQIINQNIEKTKKGESINIFQKYLITGNDIIVFITILLFIFLYTFIFHNELLFGDKEEKPVLVNERGAWLCAKKEIKRKLSYPKSANFSSIYDTTKFKDSWLIESDVIVKNSFNIHLRRKFACSIPIHNSHNCFSGCLFKE